MSRLNPSLLPLDKGLNLQTAKLLAPEGSLLDSLNYEQVDFQGQKRIEGYARYDGSLGNYQDTFYQLEGVSAGVGDVVNHDDGTLMGVVVDATPVTIALINKNYVPVTGMVTSIGTITSAVELRDALTPTEQYLAVLENNQALRNRVTELPGPVAGLHWFEDRLYAVASVTKLATTSQPRPNELFEGKVVLESGSDYAYVDGIEPSTHATGATIASLFQSRDEQQAFDETGSYYNYGWSFIHQGWEVPFEAGVSLYGELTALNQNRQNVGVQGPSSVVDDSGSPLALVQRVQATNFRPQVNGWKNYNTRDNYSLTPSNVYRADDDTYVYADAYISWTDSEVVAATEELVDYPATSTIEVQV